MNRKAAALVAQMTLEEKASLLAGRDFWTTRPIDRLGIPAIWVSDGPHGLRKAPTSEAGGLGNSLPATCFPTESALASAWDLELARDVGRAIGLEAQAQGIQIVLGPGVNMKRSPLSGRNFEYFSEDPVLTGELAAAYIDGVQSQGVGTSIKHFAVNNQESDRMVISAEVDERALREIYLRAFEIAIEKAQPTSVMAAYNRINGTYASEDATLLRRILKEEWGFDGFVVSDWGAVHDRVAGVQAGMHLEMPGHPLSTPLIVEAVREARLEEGVLDAVVTELLAVLLDVDATRRPETRFDEDAHHALARRAAAESIVLLRNDDAVLPLDPQQTPRLAVIGAFARAPRYQGAGSSQVVPTRLENAYDEIIRLAGPEAEVSYAPGYTEADTVDEALLEEARRAAQAADVALVFAGLPPAYESEGFDRTHIDLPDTHTRLIEAVAAVQERTVVILHNGSAVAMPWRDRVAGIVEAGLGGQGGGGAVADVLFGVVNPSGKLSETFPARLEDTPAFLHFPGEDRVARYGESLFIGYRYYDKKGIEPLFPFGFGLSYTSFAYTQLSLSQHRLLDTDPLTVTVTVRNTGTRSGSEVVQVYVRDVESRRMRPVKELKAFAKVALAPGEAQAVTFTLTPRDFACYDPTRGAWVAEAGAFEILVGASSRGIRLRETVLLEPAQPPKAHFDRYTTLKEWLAHPAGRRVIQPLLDPLLENLGGDGAEAAGEDTEMMQVFLLEMPLYKLTRISQGQVTEEMIADLLDVVNR